MCLAGSVAVLLLRRLGLEDGFEDLLDCRRDIEGARVRGRVAGVTCDVEVAAHHGMG